MGISQNFFLEFFSKFFSLEFLVKISSLYLEKWLSYWTKYERGHYTTTNTTTISLSLNETYVTGVGIAATMGKMAFCEINIFSSIIKIARVKRT